MGNGEMLGTIKKLIEDGEQFTAKQYQLMSLSGMVELGDNIDEVRDEIKKVDNAAQERVCPAVKQAIDDIKDLEAKSTRNDTIVSIGTIIGTIAGVIFGKK